MVFCKINGVGNDFIIVNNIKERIHEEKFSSLARKLCERHLSIGADGLIFIEQASDTKADFRMLTINADGSEAQTCGNGIRCAARFAWEEKLAGDHMKIQATAGYTEAERLSKREYKIKLQNITTFKRESRITVNGREYSYTYVEVGNPGVPHIVVPVKGLKNANRETLLLDGQSLRYHGDFPKGANVNFCEAIDDNTVELLTYERGVQAFTYACGTGSASAAMVFQLQNIIKSGVITFKVPGGLLKVELVKKTGGSIGIDDVGDTDIYLIGDTNIVCKGDALDEDFVF